MQYNPRYRICHQDGERGITQIAVRDRIIRIYGDPQNAVAMEGKGICKRLESVTCSFQHLELTERLMLSIYYDLEVCLLWQRVESRKSSLGPLIFKV
jgi:hypothetical protein